MLRVLYNNQAKLKAETNKNIKMKEIIGTMQWTSRKRQGIEMLEMLEMLFIKKIENSHEDRIPMIFSQ